MSSSLIDAFLDEAPVVLTSKREIHIAVRRDGAPDPLDEFADPVIIGDGSPQNPLDGSTIFKLDWILDPSRSPWAKRNTRFVFGPGCFYTQGGPGYGHQSSQFSWEPLPGCEFIGSGMYSTAEFKGFFQARAVGDQRPFTE